MLWNEESEELLEQPVQCPHSRRDYQELASWFGYSRCLDCGVVFPPFSGTREPSKHWP